MENVAITRSVNRFSGILKKIDSESGFNLHKTDLTSKNLSDSEFLELVLVKAIDNEFGKGSVIKKLLADTIEMREKIHETGGFVTKSEYAALTGRPKQSMGDSITRGTVIEMLDTSTGRRMIPAFQINVVNNSATELKHLHKINAALFNCSFTDLDKVKFWLSPNEALDGISPHKAVSMELNEDNEELLNLILSQIS